jgi:hypothetical protein
MSMKSRFLLHLGKQSKQAGNEGNLSNDVPFFHLWTLFCSFLLYQISFLSCNTAHFYSNARSDAPCEYWSFCLPAFRPERTKVEG